MINPTKTFSLSSGKKIYIFDNLFSLAKRLHFKEFAESSLYSLNGYLTNDSSEFSGNFLLSSYNENDLNNFGFFKDTTNELSGVYSLIGNKKLTKSWMLLSNQSTKVHYHVDGPTLEKSLISVLYSVNLQWNSSWGGETIFADEFGEPEIAVGYKPGRLMVFESSVPHRAACVSYDAPLRFTFSCVFEEEK